MKKVVRLAESDLHRIVEDSVNSFLNDVTPVPGYTNVGQLNTQQMREVYSMCTKAYQIIRDIMGTTQQSNDPYLKNALQNIAAYTRTIKGEAKYSGNTKQVKY